MTDDQFEGITHGLQSMQLDDELSSTYFINYISDDLGSQRQRDDYSQDVSAPSNCLIVTSVPQALFTDPAMKAEFEQLCRTNDSQVVVLYLKFFQRVRITFTSSFAASQAQLRLHEYSFHGQTIRAYFACPIVFRGGTSEKFLRPPEPDKLFLISPPSSPRMGWEQKFEDPPGIDLNLVAAIAQLQPNQSHELLSSDAGSNAPSIVIHTCEDIDTGDEQSHVARAKLIRPKFEPTRQPPRS